MAEYKFADNYTDLCRAHGIDAGFQFQFHCERCRDAWRTEFKPYKTARASGWLRQVSSVLGNLGLGGVGYGAGNAADGLAQAGFSSARDEAFKEAIAAAQQHFNRCAKCTQYVCTKCWDGAHGLCLGCAPDVKIEVEAARRYGEIEAARNNAMDEGRERGGRADVATERQLVCPGCNAQTRGAKFCPECGRALAASSSCGQCQAELAPGAKFCGECGTRVP